MNRNTLSPVNHNIQYIIVYKSFVWVWAGSLMLKHSVPSAEGCGLDSRPVHLDGMLEEK